MSNILPLTFLLLLMVSKFHFAKFLHEPSGIPIHPLKHENNSDFGFAMGYMSSSNKLVVGAPSENKDGRVYICNMDGANISNEVNCDKKSIIIPHSSTSNQTIKFHLGASIAATSKHYLTCAPLWTVDMQKSKNKKKELEVVGTCFLDGNHNSYKGIYEKYANDKAMGRLPPQYNTKMFVGGSGFTTLADEANDVMLVIKSSLEGNIASSPISKGKLRMKSMVSEKIKAVSWVSNYFNLGFGITGGKFFSKKTVYAFNMDTKDMRGIVEFLDYNPPHLNLMNSNMDMKIYTIQSKRIATKFGSVLAAADMNKDGFDDLLVSEPLYTEQDCVDCGALHVYLGGEMETIRDKNYLQILGIDNFGRLGSAVAVNDLDGDGVAELFVSAPYADEGLGVIYIISGYEVNKALKYKQKLQLQLSELKHTQRVQRENFRTLGFSLQVISDTDDNGCSDLVAGAPGSGAALLLKCVQVIDISLSCEITGEKRVREQDLNFTMQVCAEVKYPKKPNDISAQILLKSSIIGKGVSIPDPEVKVNVSCNNCSKKQIFCEHIFVQLNRKEPGDYIFQSEAKLITDHIFNSTVFNTSWVVAAPYSNLKTKEEISRHCQDDDCEPDLSMELFWSLSKEDLHIVGSSTEETVTIKVFNNGNSSYEACVKVTVMGAQLSRLLDHNECRESKDGYRCDLPKPLKRDHQVDIKLLLKMDSTNEYKELEVKAYLYEKCSNDVTMKDPKIKTIPYNFMTNDVSVNGANHERHFSMQQNKDKEESSIMDVQEFSITNNGKITWKNIYAKISTNKTNYSEKFKVILGTYECKESDSDKKFIRVCHLDVMPNSSLTVIATTFISNTVLETQLSDKNVKLEYKIELHLIPTEEIKIKSIYSVLKFGTELAVSQNKLLIGIIAAVVGILILIVIFIVLYKHGFFKRKEKKKLLVHRESIKQRSIRRNTHISSVVEEQGAHVEGITDITASEDGDDDCVFDKDIISKTTNGDGIQIKTKVQVH